MDISRISTCSIAVIEQPPNMAFDTIRPQGTRRSIYWREPRISRYFPARLTTRL